ncbi:MAG: hypothetical protein HND58_19115 [Planctomycetota bacterium]|nr:MAG: hypothetical protein HND58_19115 [Planctomycetota bacterium]
MSKPHKSASARPTTADRDRARARALLRWFRANARDLPWRDRPLGSPRDPYRVLVSELMLQQTQASRVIERFEEFVNRFPTVEALARADEPEVLALWSGLGYYRRARLLHAAARAIADQHDGRFPSAAARLAALPGIGRYTAGRRCLPRLPRTHPRRGRQRRPRDAPPRRTRAPEPSPRRRRPGLVQPPRHSTPPPRAPSPRPLCSTRPSSSSAPWSAPPALPGAPTARCATAAAHSPRAHRDASPRPRLPPSANRSFLRP